MKWSIKRAAPVCKDNVGHCNKDSVAKECSRSSRMFQLILGVIFTDFH